MRQEPGVQLRELFAKIGSFYPVRENFCLTPEVKAAFTEKLKTDSREVSGRKLVEVVPTDGHKLILDDGSWLCLGDRTRGSRTYRGKEKGP